MFLQPGTLDLVNTAPGYLLTFSLQTTAAEVLAQFGKPARASSSGDLYIYDYEDIDRDEYAWSFVFSLATDQPLCVTRRFALPQDLRELFPENLAHVQQGRGQTARVRALDSGRVLVGIGSQQVLLIKPPALKRFLPWISFA